MAGYAIGKSMNLGFPGTYARTPDDVIMSRAVKEDSKAIPFGAPVILNSDNTYSVGDATLTADNFAGVAVRIVQQAVQYLAQNSGAYQPTQPCSVIQHGNVMVTCNVGTPTAGGKVYVRTAGEDSGSGKIIGGFEATDDSGNVVELPNVCWATGKIDANKVAEICIKTRNNP